MATKKSARDEAIAAAKERARQKVLQKSEEATETNKSVDATASQDAANQRMAFTANQQVMADQQMAGSDRTPDAGADTISTPGITPAAGTGTDAEQADAASTRAAMREAVMQGGAVSDTSTEGQAALDVFNQVTSGNAHSLVGAGPETPDGPTTGGISPNTYDGTGRRAPSQADIALTQDQADGIAAATIGVAAAMGAPLAAPAAAAYAGGKVLGSVTGIDDLGLGVDTPAEIAAAAEATRLAGEAAAAAGAAAKAQREADAAAQAAAEADAKANDAASNAKTPEEEAAAEKAAEEAAAKQKAAEEAKKAAEEAKKAADEAKKAADEAAASVDSSDDPTGESLTLAQRAALAARAAELAGGVDPRAGGRGGDIDYGEGGTGQFVEGQVTSDYRDRLTGDGDDLVEGGGGGGALPRGTMPDQGNVINWGPDGNALSEPGRTEDMPSDFGPDTDLSGLVGGITGNDSSSSSRGDDDDDSSGRS